MAGGTDCPQLDSLIVSLNRRQRRVYMKDYKDILILPLIIALSAILHVCSQSLAHSSNDKERNILCNPLTKETDKKDFRSPMLPIVPDPCPTVGCIVLLPPF